MEITCPRCQTRHLIDTPASARVRPQRTLKFRCSHCGHTFAVEPAGSGAPTEAPAPRPEPPRLGPELVGAPPGEPIQMLQSNGQLWPVPDLATFLRWILEHRVSRNDMVSHHGLRWQRVGERADLELFFLAADRLRQEAPSRDAAPAGLAVARRATGVRLDLKRDFVPASEEDVVVDSDEPIPAVEDEPSAPHHPASAALRFPTVEPRDEPETMATDYSHNTVAVPRDNGRDETQEQTLRTGGNQAAARLVTAPIPDPEATEYLRGLRAHNPLPTALDSMFSDATPLPRARTADVFADPPATEMSISSRRAFYAVMGVIGILLGVVVFVWWTGNRPPAVAALTTSDASRGPTAIASVIPAAPVEGSAAAAAVTAEAPLAEKPVAEKPVAEKPVAEKPVAPVAEKPVAPVAEKPVAPVAEKRASPVAAKEPKPAAKPKSAGGTPGKLVALGWAAVGKGDMQGAHGLFSRALQANPQLADALYGRGYASEKLGDAVSAGADYCEAVNAGPSTDISRELIAGLKRTSRTCP